MNRNTASTRRGGGFLLAAALAAFFALQGAPLFAARSAQEINVYTALEDDQIPVYLQSFNRSHPDIKLNIVRDSTGIVTAKLLAEKNNPQADVIWGLAATSLLILDKEGMLEGYAPKGLERVLPQFRDPANPPRWVGIDAWMTAFVVNTVESGRKNLPMPASYADLLNPVYRGGIAMPNPASSGTGYLTVSAILQLFGEQKGWEYLDKLNQNIAVYTHSGSKPAKLAGSGEYPIGISFGYRGIIQKRKGEPVEVVFPKEGSGWDLESNALVKKPAIKQASKTFLDWAIGDEVMKEYGKNFAVVSIKTDAPPPEGFPREPLKQMIKNDFRWAAENRERILQKWTERYDSKSEPR